MTGTIDAFVRPSWCEIDLDAPLSNLKTLRRLLDAETQIFVCLKSDAMGLGARAVAKVLDAAGVDGLAFGTIDQALDCRAAGVSAPMLIYPSCLPEQADILRRNTLMPSLSTRNDVAAWDAQAGPPLDVFLKIDAGGYRAGAFADQAPAVARAITQSRHLRLAGIYGHPMASYGVGGDSYTEDQIDEFLRALALIRAEGIEPPISMVSSSEIVLRYPQADLTAVDPGRLIVTGIDFPAAPARAETWRSPLGAIKSRLVMTKDLPFDPAVAAPFVDREKVTRIGLIPLGWSDGLPTKPPHGWEVLIRGQRTGLLGPVHSELTRVELSHLPEAEIGDEVTFLGRDGPEEITLTDLAGHWQMDPLDIYVSLVKFLPKHYAGY